MNINPKQPTHPSTPPHLGKHSLKDVIQALTSEEKINLVLGTGMAVDALPDDLQGPVVGDVDGRVPGAAGTTVAIPRLSIPALVMADGPAGVRIHPQRDNEPDKTYHCTRFPIASLLASSWDVDLLERVGRAMGNEAREYGIDILLTPALNIHRHPLGGRNFEYYAEDPLLSGQLAAAMVNGVQSQGVGASIKHFVANNHEWNRYSINVKVDQRALREIYLKGFEIAVKASQPWTVMTSYNKLNGTYTSERRDLLTEILRDQWGFTGLVMTDWFGGDDAIAQMNAGNDLLMPGSQKQQQVLQRALVNDELDASTLDTNIENLLRVIQQTPVFKAYQYSDNPDLKTHAAIARTAATEGMVLLHNRAATLPLSPKLTIALFGNSAYQTVAGGSGSGDVNAAYTVSLQQGLAAAGYTSHRALGDDYATFIADQMTELPPQALFRPPPTIAERSVSPQQIETVATQVDMATISIGRYSGEFADRNAENDFYLSGTEKQLIEQVASTFHSRQKKVVVILNVGGVIDTASWRDQVDAILLAWQPGQEAGHAMADLLSGRVNPSGKLTTTFAMTLDDYPSSQNFPGDVLEQTLSKQALLQQSQDDNMKQLFNVEAAEVSYEDSIWVGYRAFSTRKLHTAYPFGFGLSYTTFQYDELQLSDKQFEKELEVKVTITNTGAVAGKEVVQLYITAPQGNLIKPTLELKGFAKTECLAPGASQILRFTLGESDLVSFDPDTDHWVCTPGTYCIHIGASSEDIRLSNNVEKTEETYLPLEEFR